MYSLPGYQDFDSLPICVHIFSYKRVQFWWLKPCAMVSSLDNTSTIQTHPTNIQYPPSRRAQYFLLHPILNQGWCFAWGSVPCKLTNRFVDQGSRTFPPSFNQDVPRWVVKLATVLELRVGRVIFLVIWMGYECFFDLVRIWFNGLMRLKLVSFWTIV